jgi:hypothetical protein
VESIFYFFSSDILIVLLQFLLWFITFKSEATICEMIIYNGVDTKCSQLSNCGTLSTIYSTIVSTTLRNKNEKKLHFLLGQLELWIIGIVENSTKSMNEEFAHKK